MTLPRALADAAGALDRLQTRAEARGALALVGFSFGGGVAALAAGRDPRIRAAALAAAPARFEQAPDDEPLDPVTELSRTRAAVLLIWGSRDTEVPLAHAERYRAGLLDSSVPLRVVTIEGGDHDFAPAGPRAEMAQTVAAWIAERIRR
jgi:dienelactone hydrolase